MKKLGIWATLSLIGLIAMAAPRTAAAAGHGISSPAPAINTAQDGRDGDPSLIG